MPCTHHVSVGVRHRHFHEVNHQHRLEPLPIDTLLPRWFFSGSFALKIVRLFAGTHLWQERCVPLPVLMFRTAPWAPWILCTEIYKVSRHSTPMLLCDCCLGTNIALAVHLYFDSYLQVVISSHIMDIVFLQFLTFYPNLCLFGYMSNIANDL